MASQSDLSKQHHNMTGSSLVPEAQLAEEHDSAVALANLDLADPLMQNHRNEDKLFIKD